MSSVSNHFYEFEGIRFDAERRVLWRDGDVVALPPKASEVLLVLLEERGNLVGRQEILDRVWADTFVEEGNLNQAISALRKALGGDVIQTVPKRGYRFAAPVRESEPAGTEAILIEKRTVSASLVDEFEESPVASVTPSQAAALAAPKRGLWLPLAVAGCVLLAGVTLVLVFGIGGKASDGRRARPISSLAVLPLKPFSDEKEISELSLRITDALITKLGKFDNLVVRPTNSVLRFARRDGDVAAIGSELGVDAVLDGRLQEEAGRLRVTFQLISVSDGSQLWSEQFDGKVGETLALQDLIANRFGSDLAFVNSREGQEIRPANNEAYEAYLKGRYLWNQRRKETYYKALEFFDRSIQLDPNFALGYTGVADTYHLLQQRNVISTIDAFAKAEAAARRAYELDPNLAEANTSMGHVMHIRYVNWTEAEKFYLRAIELNRNLAEPYARLGMLYNSWGRFDEALAVLQKAVELDPTSINNAIYLGAHYYFSKQFDKAETQFKRILEFAPGTERAHFFLTRIYELQGKHDLAVEHAVKEREVFRPQSVEPLREAYKKQGIKGFWRKQIELLEEESKEMFALENHIASRYVLLGDYERAIDYVEKNLENLGSMHNYGRVDPLFEKLHNHTRYIAAMSKTAPPPPR
jgi:DNA-binding winged helix-turn-helix (wHTH) protein/TolB-like protein/Flp pilus assembly protein TadD